MRTFRTLATEALYRCRRGAFLALCVLVLIAGCSTDDLESPESYIAPSTPSQRPNVFVIMIDTLRSDHLKLYGYTRETAPNLTLFAERATVFTNAISPGPWTLPSVTSVLIGKFGFKHDFHRNDLLPSQYDLLPPLGDTILPYIIGQSGYKTYSIQANAFVSVVDKQFQERATINTYPLSDPYAVQNAVSWLANNGNSGSPVLVSLGFMGPHWPYETETGYMHGFLNDTTFQTAYIGNYTANNVNMPMDCIMYKDLTPESRAVLPQGLAIINSCFDDSRVYVAAYDGEIRYTDARLGEFFEALKHRGIYDSSMIILFSDHGESMDDSNPYFKHGNSLFQRLLHVPLLIKLPGQKDKGVVKRYVRTIDIYPTVMDYLGLTPPAGVDGKSLLPLLYHAEVGEKAYPIVSYQVYKDAPRASFIEGRYKLIINAGSAELYDLETDPGERSDLSALEPDRVLAIKDALSHYYAMVNQW